ncbi:MAG: EAL domain-containing protein [Proteobacteria bacterium]|nr:EAL domain-containing protein [Pseudomonadota bacterium]
MRLSTSNGGNMKSDLQNQSEQRIFIVDDDKDFADALQDMLGPEGYVIKVSYDVDSVQQLVTQFRPHVALLDIRIGDNCGISLLQQMKQLCPDTVCIILTAYANIETSIDSLRLGAYDYLRKPADPDDLLATLRRCFDMLHLTKEKMRAEAALRESEERFRSLVTNIPGVIYRCASDNTFSMHYMSDMIEKICGYPAADFIDNNVSSYASIIHPDDLASVKSAVQRANSRGEPYELEYRILHKDGNVRWVYDKGQIVSDAYKGESWQDGAIFDITESHNLSEQLNYQASHDALTDLVNRREFEYRLERVLETAREEQSEHALCYLDLDQFKVINDTCGHVAGDELLRQLSSLLKKEIRKRDTLARLGGDEFGVLMEHCSLEQARRVALKLRKAVERYRFAWQERSFALGVSIGLVPITETSMNTIEILKQADAACYAAKDAGRNRIHIYKADDVDLARRSGEMQWVEQINLALEKNHFCLYAQPIMPLTQNDYSWNHYELLVRMRNEDGSLIPPGAFLPAAERYNLSTRLDTWVVENYLNWLIAHPQHLAQLSQCAINLSGLSLGDEQFLDWLVHRFEQTAVPPDKICFEITETAAIANLSSATMFIKTLKALGCRFALDDFGSGLSSFAYLKTLPVDYLKIDGVFVKGIKNDPIDLAMVKSINDIGKVMGKQTIAEFVENKFILDRLKEIGVDYAQGFHISKPRPIDEIVSITIASKTSVM